MYKQEINKNNLTKDTNEIITILFVNKSIGYENGLTINKVDNNNNVIDILYNGTVGGFSGKVTKGTTFQNMRFNEESIYITVR